MTLICDTRYDIMMLEGYCDLIGNKKYELRFSKYWD